MKGLAGPTSERDVTVAFHQWGFIYLGYLGAGTEDPRQQRAVIEHGGLRTTFVAVPDRVTAVTTAVELVSEGAQSLELCGAFGPSDAAAVLKPLVGGCRSVWLRMAWSRCPSSRHSSPMTSRRTPDSVRRTTLPATYAQSVPVPPGQAADAERDHDDG